MCGPYIHGRTVVFRAKPEHTEPYRTMLDDFHNIGGKLVRIDHYCKPMEVNSHREIDQRLHVAHSLAHYCNYSPMSAERGIVVGDLIIEKLSGEVTDWGICPWDGEIVPQRFNGDTWEETRKAIHEQNFFFPKKDSLVAWAKTHWGKLADAEEFCVEMVRCLDCQALVDTAAARVHFADPFFQTSAHERYVTHKLLEQAFTSEPRAWEAPVTQRDVARVSMAVENCTARSLPLMESRLQQSADMFADLFAAAPSPYWRHRS